MSTDSASVSLYLQRLRAVTPRRRRIVLTMIVLTGLLLRLALFAIAWGHPERFLEPDSTSYLAVGDHFSAAVLHGSGPYVGLTIFRPPGYPAFIALIHALSPSTRVLVFVQIALTALTTILVYLVTKRLFDETAGLIGALIVSIDPVSVVYSAYVMTETLFTLVLLFATWTWLEAVRHRSVALGAAAGSSYASAALVRPNGVFLLLVLIPLSLFLPRGGQWFRVALALVVTVSFAVPVGGWMLRNRELTGSAVYASEAGYTLLYYSAAGALRYQEHVPISVARQQLQVQAEAALQGDANEAHKNQVETHLAIHTLVTHPLGTGVVAARGAVLTLLGPGQDSLDQLVLGPDRRGWEARVLLMIEVCLLAFALFGTVLGVRRAWLSGSGRRSVAVLLTLIGYSLIFSAGYQSYSRFRVPILPFIAALSGFGWSMSAIREDDSTTTT